MAMLLKGKDGTEFELGFVHDTLPDQQDGVGDATWVTAGFRAASESGTWEESSPCMNLFEFSRLAEWLEAAGANEDGGADSTEIALLQPELRFALTRQSPGDVTLRISFHIADRPEEFNVDAPTDARFIELHLDRASVRTAGRQLRDMVRELDAANLKDDLSGDQQHGVLGEPDDDRRALHSITPEPPGVSFDPDEGYTREP